MKCTFPRYNLRDNSLQLVVRHLSSFFPFSRLLHLLFVRALVYIFPMKNCFHNPPIDTPSKEVLWFYDFTKKKKKRPFHTTIVATRRHVTITRAKILRVSGKVVIPRFLAIVSHSICQRGCIFSLSFLSYSRQRKAEEKRSSCIRPFFFPRVVQRKESYVPRRAYRFVFPTCLSIRFTGLSSKLFLNCFKFFSSFFRILL